jgi:hypothetical protein
MDKMAYIDRVGKGSFKNKWHLGEGVDEVSHKLFSLYEERF